MLSLFQELELVFLKDISFTLFYFAVVIEYDFSFQKPVAEIAWFVLS